MLQTLPRPYTAHGTLKENPVYSTHTNTSDTNYLELARTPQVWGSMRLLLPNFRCQSQVHGPHTSGQPVINRTSPFDNFLGWLIELRKALYLWSPIYYKRHNSGGAEWKRRPGRGTWEGTERPCPPGAPPSQHLSWPRTLKLPKPCTSGFLQRL